MAYGSGGPADGGEWAPLPKMEVEMQAADVDWKRMERVELALAPTMQEYMARLSRAVGGTEVWADSMDIDYWVSFRVERVPGEMETCLDVALKLIDSGEYDTGEYDVRGNVILDLVEYGGRIVGGISPYNYTDRVWVDYNDLDEFTRRLESIIASDEAIQVTINAWKAED